MAPGAIGTLIGPTGKPRPLRAQRGEDAAHGVQPIDGAARQNQRVDALDGHAGFEQGGVAQARRAAMHGDRGRGGAIENHGGDAGGEFSIMRIADCEAGDIGDEVFQRGCLRTQIGFLRTR